VEATWKGIVNGQALKVQSAQTQAATAASAKDSAYSDLDNVSGVNLDTEAADLMRFQQAYSASAKIIQTARDTLQSILALF
jgi:flagellar hook-associated protein 1 FlgK